MVRYPLNHSPMASLIPSSNTSAVINWLLVPEVADRLRLFERSVRRLIARGLLPARRIGTTRRIRVAAADVDCLLRPVGEAAANDLDGFIDQATARWDPRPTRHYQFGNLHTSRCGVR